MSYELDSHIQENTYGLDRFGNLLNKITSPILLGITYFLILTPIAWLYRLFNRTEEEQDSTMNERVKTYSKEDFIHPW